MSWEVALAWETSKAAMSDLGDLWVDDEAPRQAPDSS